MICYICGQDFSDDDIKQHAVEEHLNFDVCFAHLLGKSPEVLRSRKEKPKYQFKFSEVSFSTAAENKTVNLEYRMSRSCVVPFLKPFPEIKPIPSEFLPINFFGEYPESLVAIRQISPADITFDLTARIMCQQCGGYGKRRKCPPTIKSPAFWEKYFKQWDLCYILVWQSDGRAGWPNQRADSQRQWGRSLIGVDVALSHFAYKLLEDVTNQMRKNGKMAIMAPPGPCIYCRTKGCNFPPKKCRHPLPGGPAMEGMGIDVVNLMHGLGIPIQQPVFDFLTKVGAIFVEEGK